MRASIVTHPLARRAQGRLLCHSAGQQFGDPKSSEAIAERRAAAWGLRRVCRSVKDGPGRFHYLRDAGADQNSPILLECLRPFGSFPKYNDRNSET